MLTLYFSPGSSAMATHIALYEVGARSRRDRHCYTRTPIAHPNIWRSMPKAKCRLWSLTGDR
jgi:hypothetical protein